MTWPRVIQTLIIYEKLMLPHFYLFSRLCLQSCVSQSSYTVKIKTLLLQWFTTKPFKTTVNLIVRSTKNKKVTSYVNVQLSFKSCFCFLSMSIYTIKPISSLCFNRSKVNKHGLLQRETNALVSSFLVQRSDLLFKTNRPKHLH